MDADDLGWIRARTRHAARLYDRFRLDHVVGYFRMWVKPPGGSGRFEPGDEAAQVARGIRVLRAILEGAEGSAHVVAEDLGLVPPFVRAALRDLGVPGYRVIPWELDDARHFRDPHAFPHVSVASFSTHDTKPITTWWDDFSPEDRHGSAASTSARRPRNAASPSSACSWTPAPS
jgi:4-alpha-glucanotransferase